MNIALFAGSTGRFLALDRAMFPFAVTMPGWWTISSGIMKDGDGIVSSGIDAHPV
jgi:hypothetical protein